MARRLPVSGFHQIRSSTKYVSWKDIKQVTADLKKSLRRRHSGPGGGKSASVRGKVAETVSLLREKLGGKLGSFEHLL